MLLWTALLGCVTESGEMGPAAEVAATGEAYHAAVKAALEQAPGKLLRIDCSPEPCVALLQMPPLEEDAGASRQQVKQAIRDAGYGLAVPVLLRQEASGRTLLAVAAATAKAEDRAAVERRMRQLVNAGAAKGRVTVDPTYRE